MNLFKKIVCFCFLLLFSDNIVWAQCPDEDIHLETQAEVNEFAILYPNCTQITEDLRLGRPIFASGYTNITDLSPLSQINSVEGSLNIYANANLLDLNGLNSLISVGQQLVIEGNLNLVNLSDLENLTSVGIHLRIDNNDDLYNLNGLESLTSIGDGLFIRYNDNLVVLNGLDNLTSIGGELDISQNDNLNSLSALQNVTSIGSGLNIHYTNLTSLTGLENVTSSVDFLSVSYNDNLVSLIGLDNLVLNPYPNLWIRENPLLSFCSIPSICSHVENGGFITTFYSNAPGCRTELQISNVCSATSRIKTNAFYDINQDKVQDTNEPNYYDASILIEPNPTFYHPQNGIFYTEPGNYTATFDTINNANWQLTTDSVSYFLNLEDGGAGTITFGIYPTQQVSHIQTIVNSAPARCNERITLDVTTKNLGTTIASGTMWLTIDDAIPDFTFIHQPDTIVEGGINYYGWHFTDLYPGQTIIKNVEVTVPGPPDFELGEQLLFVSFSEFMDENGEDGSEGFRYNPEVRCSFDPNDKLINPNREGDYVLFDEDLIYTVRFQNTGNDVAYDVVIRDTLDANLDLSTFRLLGSSHANRLNTILNEDERILTFEFRDIFLPDSTSNFDASQGYANYLIHTIDGLAEETPVTNSAGIYFDLNPPVITNTTQSIMVSELPTVSTEIPDNLFNFNILPNPNSGVFTVQNISTGTYQILNTSGQIIRQGDMKNDLLIDISREAQGVYFISVTVDDATLVRRIVKM